MRVVIFNKKYIFFVLLLCFLSVLFLTGCQPTPKKEIVENKADSELEDKINNSAELGLTINDNETVIENIDSKVVSLCKNGEWQEEFTAGNVNVHIDADVFSPESENIPVARIEYRKITEDLAKKIAEALFSDVESITLGEQFTKAQLEEIILEYKMRISNLKNNGAPPDDDRPVSDQIDELEYQLSLYEKNYVEYDGLLENEDIEANFTFYPIDFEGQQLPGLRYTVKTTDGKFSNFEVLKDRPGYGDILEYSTSEFFSEYNAPMTKNEEQAKLFACEFLNKLDLGEYSLISSTMNTDANCFVFEFGKSIDGIPFTEISASMGASGGVITEEELIFRENDPFFEGFTNEKITMAVNDNNVLYFCWMSPWQIEYVENDNVEIISFDAAKDIFREQIKYAFPPYNDEINLTINSVMLGFRYSRIKDMPGEYRAIPVYDFVGYEDWIRDLGLTSESCLAINAIDGSIFDLNNNY